MTDTTTPVSAGKLLPSVVYAEKTLKQPSQLDRILRRIEGEIQSRFVRSRLRGLTPVLKHASDFEGTVEAATDEELRHMAKEAAFALKKKSKSVECAARVFAIIREASKRTLGMRHHDVQLLGGYALLLGNLAEMNTGEGKSLTATLPAIAVALTGTPVHIVTVNDYLAERDAIEMSLLFSFFGLTVSTRLAPPF